MNENNPLCPICKTKKKDSGRKYCEIHNTAKMKLQEGYESWLKAYGSLSWDDYFQKLLNLVDTIGDFIKDIVEFELYFK